MHGAELDPTVDIDDIETESGEVRARGLIEAERQCKITLSADWPRSVPLQWNPGGRHGRNSVIDLKPGHTVVQPLAKAMAWFGPFALPAEFLRTTDERRRDFLRDLYRTEKERYLKRYDYPRGNGRGQQPDMRPTGHHRSPNVTVTIVNADGTEEAPIILHKLYKIGEWDPIKDTFGIVETVDEVREAYEARLAEERKGHETEMQAMRREIAELTGLVKGSLIASAERATVDKKEPVASGKGSKE